MLTHLNIQNFTLVDHLELDIKAGMTVITGETGAGKSIVLDALGQALGDRADPERVRAGASRADICATFDTHAIPAAQQWLKQHDFQQADAPYECLLRRVVGADGKSKAYINGQSVTLAQLRGLGDLLIDIHSQHEHQSLLLKETHRRLLDDYAGNADLVTHVKQAFREWQARLTHFIHLRDNAAEVNARFQLLRYQADELEQLGLGDNELQKLEAEQRSLANADDIMRGSQQVLGLCSDDEQGLHINLHRALNILRAMPEKSAALAATEELLQSAQIQIDEAQHELERHIDHFQADPQRLEWVEERLSAIYDMARKHRIQPDELTALAERIANELEQLAGADGQLDVLADQVAQLEKAYRKLSAQLSTRRQKASKELSSEVNAQLKRLSMVHATFVASLIPTPDKPSAQGDEDIEFLISTNPGQPPRPLAKVASGGELSRVSLAIQVVTAQTSAIPTLVFDEVDVGIGGATGDIVGELLRQLGERGQVICVTHLAQVASRGHQHLQVVKKIHKKQAESTLVELNHADRVEEIARMLGGLSVNEHSLAHAQAMLSHAQ